jgi:3-methyladenine DNA glycosylase AlkC
MAYKIATFKEAIKLPEQLKDIYSKEFLIEFSEKIKSVYPAFQTTDFIASIMNETWDKLTLKARFRMIAEKLGVFLPSKYEDALDILFSIADDCVGFPYLFFPDFVAVYGQEEKHWELSMSALENFTEKSSSEFAIRQFLLRDPKRVMNRMTAWATHPNEHVRRFASEGCRPRLPWGEALPIFKKDPTPVLNILELLKEDPSLYVRKSVANNLNDISKDNPNLVLETARRWKGKTPDTDWIIRHGCRSLIRNKHPEAMELFGYAKEAQITTHASIIVHPDVLTIGESCELQYELTIRQGEDAHIRMEYGIDFVKARGQVSRKAFLLSDKTVSGGTHLTGTRSHNWSNLTTRKHYPGEHPIVLLVNGQEVAHTVLTLQQPPNKSS